MVVLPVVVTVIGFVEPAGPRTWDRPTSPWLTAGAAGSLLIGLAFGADHAARSPATAWLWAKLPLRGLWLWVALAAWRVLIMVLAARTGAHVAASTTPLLFTLGLNRLGQGVVIVLRAVRAGLAFAPEKDGSTFGAGAFGGHDRDASRRY